LSTAAGLLRAPLPELEWEWRLPVLGALLGSLYSCGNAVEMCDVHRGRKGGDAWTQAAAPLPPLPGW